ncbi:MAG: PASTA domain-containing protein [Clostridia bacterium]|nr:PASTA domain-containing protein [Clostridia bacterium]
MAVNPDGKMIKRITIIMISLLVVFAILTSGGLFFLTVIRGEELQNKASEQQLYDSLVSAPRGDICDRNGKMLATSATAWTVYLTPGNIRNVKEKDEQDKIRKKIAENLAEVLGLEYDAVYEKTTKNVAYIYVKKKVDKETADRVRALLSEEENADWAKYIGLDETNKRYYPNGSLASTVLGFVGDDDQGLYGLEKYYENELTGVAGRVVSSKNARGMDMRYSYQKVENAKKGTSLTLTIDSYIQHVCEKYLDEAVVDNKVEERGAVVVMNVNTGAIYAMAVSGDFDPNEPLKLSDADQQKVDAVTDEEEAKNLRRTLLDAQWRNKIVSDTYEPGSVFKMFTASTAIEENLINKSSTFTCNYAINVAGQLYHCHKAGGHGTQNLPDAIAHSCNPAFITIGQLVGSKLFSTYFKAFGLTERTGIDLPGEATSYYHKEEKMGVTELASSSFGQTFNLTPIQVITMVSAVVNGGYLVQPHMVAQKTDANGKVINVTPTTAKRQVLSEATSKTMRELLEHVILTGVKNGYVPGYRVGGKTGTSEKISKMLQTGVKGLYIASFATVAPINDPEIALLILLDEPKGTSYYGSTTAAPVGAKIMADILPYLGYEAQYSQEELQKLSIPVPNVKTLDLASAKGKLATSNLNYKVVGTGETVVSQLPEEGSSLYTGGTVILYTDGGEQQNATVPQFVGMTAAEANATAASVGVNISLSGNLTASGLRAYSQSIPAGSTVPMGTVVSVSFRDESGADLAAN